MNDNWTEPLIKNIQQKAEVSCQKQDGDYINAEDGLLYCGKCHTPKQKRFPDTFEVKSFAGTTQAKMCACQAAEYYRKQAEQHRNSLIPDLLERCFGRDSDAIRQWTFENDKGRNPELMTAAKEYYHMVTDENAPEELRHKGLLICGAPGRGKSYAAYSILNALMREQCLSCQLVKLKTVANTLWNSTDREGYIEQLTSARFLCIDELREDYLREGKSELVYDLLERRQESGKPVIITTNIPLREFYRQDLPIDLYRIYDRIVGMCLPVEVTTESIRRRNAADDMKAYNAYLHQKDM